MKCELIVPLLSSSKHKFFEFFWFVSFSLNQIFLCLSECVGCRLHLGGNGLNCEKFIAKRLQVTFSKGHVTRGFSNFVANVVPRFRCGRRFAELLLYGDGKDVQHMFLSHTDRSHSN